MSPRVIVPVVAVAALAVAWAVRSAAQEPEPLPPPQPVESKAPAAAEQRFHLVGATGCAAAACHNTPVLPGAGGFEYATWVHDPHGRAANTLGSPLWAAILTSLKGSAYTEALCLKCHVTPTGTDDPLPPGLLADGIGCESCHGPAEKWLTTHYRRSWKGQSQAAKEKLGFYPTKDLGKRIEKCAECHVGNDKKDVNHDLIAAGHPRLNFEYTAYHHLLPRHWRDTVKEAFPLEDKSKKFGLDFDATAWVVGQAVTAKASADLTAARAAKANEKTHPWPEFSEYACYACHHDLKPKQDDNPGSTWRQTARDGLKLGELPWGTWPRPGPLALSRLGAAVAPKDGDPFAGLATVLNNLAADPKEARAKAQQAANKLAAWRDKVKDEKLDAAAVSKLLTGLVADGLAHPPREWDDAAQHYLGLAALYEALTDLDPAAATPARHDLFRKLRAILAFPPAGEKQYNSPAEFAPTKYEAALKLFAAEFRTPDAP